MAAWPLRRVSPEDAWSLPVTGVSSLIRGGDARYAPSRALLKGGGRSAGRRPVRHAFVPWRRSLPHRAGCTRRLCPRQPWRWRSRPEGAAILETSVCAGAAVVTAAAAAAVPARGSGAGGIRARGGGRRAGGFVAAAAPQEAALSDASAFAGWSHRRRSRQQRQKRIGRPGGSRAHQSCPGRPGRQQKCQEGAASSEKIMVFMVARN